MISVVMWRGGDLGRLWDFIGSSGGFGLDVVVGYMRREYRTYCLLLENTCYIHFVTWLI